MKCDTKAVKRKVTRQLEFLRTSRIFKMILQSSMRLLKFNSTDISSHAYISLFHSAQLCSQHQQRSCCLLSHALHFIPESFRLTFPIQILFSLRIQTVCARDVIKIFWHSDEFRLRSCSRKHREKSLMQASLWTWDTKKILKFMQKRNLKSALVTSTRCINRAKHTHAGGYA